MVSVVHAVTKGYVDVCCLCCCERIVTSATTRDHVVICDLCTAGSLVNVCATTKGYEDVHGLCVFWSHVEFHGQLSLETL